MNIWATNQRERLEKLEAAKQEKIIADSNRAAAEANEKAGKAEAQAAMARLQQEELRNKNLELELRLETERRERLRIQERIAPRRLTLNQMSSLSTGLRKVPPQTVILRVHLSAPDGTPFANDLYKGISDGGWSIVETGNTPEGGDRRGIVIFSRPATGKHEAANHLAAVLKSIGVEATVVPYDFFSTRTNAPMMMIVLPKE